MIARFVPLLGLAVLCAAGCTPTYQIYVNSYSELGAPFGKEVPIAVTTDPKSQNPVLDNRARAKVERLLSNDGYNVVPADKAEYRLSLQLGMRTEGVVGYVPYYHDYYWGGYGSHRGYGFGYTAMTPYVDTYVNQWLSMRLAHVTPGEPNEGKVVWVADASMETEKMDIRQAMDYLLVGCVQEFGIDTHGRVVIPIRQDDLRIQDIRSAP